MQSQKIVDASADRLAFHGVTSATGALLRDNKDYILSILPDALNSFYDHVERFPEAQAFFRDRRHMEHAKQKQIEHWRILLEGTFNGKPSAWTALPISPGRPSLRSYEYS